MGYRSDVTAIFYVSKAPNVPEETYKKALALFDLWWHAVEQEQMFIDGFGGSVKTREPGERLFEFDCVKWYDSYPEVQWFNSLKGRFQDELCDNAELDGGSGVNKWFCAEFVRIGENYEDVVTEYHGYSTEYRVNVHREITVD